jgi:hypothetical protein
MGLKAAVEHFDFQYVVKVDTDTFVDVPRLIDYVVEKGANSSTFYAGVLGLGPYPFLYPDFITLPYLHYLPHPFLSWFFRF